MVLEIKYSVYSSTYPLLMLTVCKFFLLSSVRNITQYNDLYAFIITLFCLNEHVKSVKLCESLPLRISWRFAQALYLCAGSGHKISKTNIRANVGSH